MDGISHPGRHALHRRRTGDGDHHAGPAAGAAEVITRLGSGTWLYFEEEGAVIAQVVKSVASVWMDRVRAGGRGAPGVRFEAVVNRHRPSVDVLFRSVAHVAGSCALGIMTTGMVTDGIIEMHRAGARTVAQTKECVVYGKPGEAVKRGDISAPVSLDAIAEEIVRYGA